MGSYNQFLMSETNFRVAILASGDRESRGGGSTAERVIRDTLEGKVNFTVGVVICNNSRGTVGVYDKVDALNAKFGLRGDSKITVETINSSTHQSGPQPRGQTLGESAAICQLLRERDIDFVALNGYMKVLNGEFVQEWGWRPEYGQADPTHNGIYHRKARILNNHPAILPDTADTHGPGAHARAIELFRAGRLRQTAMTFHLAAPGVDTGPVIHEELVPIFETDDADSLGTRVQNREKELTAPTIQRHLLLREEHLYGDS